MRKGGGNKVDNGTRVSLGGASTESKGVGAGPLQLGGARGTFQGEASLTGGRAGEGESP